MYQDGYRPSREPEFFRFGTLWHTGQEAWWKARLETQDPPVTSGSVVTRSLDAALLAVYGKGEDAYEQARVEELLIGYDRAWIEDLWKWKVHEVEVEFEAPLLNPETLRGSQKWTLGGKVDGILEDRQTTRIATLEHKTTSESIESDADAYWLRLALDPQISFYVIGAEALGYEVSECVYDVIFKPQIRPLKATPEASRKYTKEGKLYAAQRDKDETPEEFRLRLREEIAANPNKYFRRKVVPRSNSQLQDFMFDTWQLAQQLSDSIKLGRSPRNPDSCFKWGSPCPFWDVCANGKDPATSSDFRILANVHPELGEPNVTNEKRSA